MDKAGFVAAIVNRVKAGYGGIAVKTVEGHDLVQLLAGYQVEHQFILITIGPNDRARVFSGLHDWMSDITSLKHLVQTHETWADKIIRDWVELAKPNVINASSLPEVTMHLAYAFESIPAERIRYVVFIHNSISDELRKNPAFIHMLQQASYAGRASNITYLLHTDSGDVGPALSPYYPLVEFPTPQQDEILDIVWPIVSQRDSEVTLEDLSEVADACRGLTRREIEDISAMLVRSGDHMDPEAYKVSKIQKAEQDGLFRVITPDKSQELFGLDGLFEFAKPLMLHRGNDSLLKPKGLLFVGPPGSGKSAAAVELAKRSHRTLCQVDFGSLRNKWVGETEARFDRMFQLVESLSPSILYVDELEKALDGTESSGTSDGGVGSRVLAKFLSWAQDHEEDVMLIATANDVQKILMVYPEMLRAERFDATFMFDLPNLESRQAMWRYYLKFYDLGAVNGTCRELGMLSHDWTGAEIKSCCRLAAMRSVPVKDQMPLIPKVYTMAAEVLANARDYAVDKFVDASTGRLYSKPVSASNSKRRRKVDPDAN